MRTKSDTQTRSDCFLRIKTVMQRTGLSRSTLYRRIQKGTFPKQIQISDRCIAWRESAIDAWLSDPKSFSSAGEA